MYDRKGLNAKHMRPSPQTITENPKFFIVEPLIAGPEKSQCLAFIGCGYEVQYLLRSRSRKPHPQ